MSIEAFYLENRSGSSEKFYRCFLDGRLVIAEWGRIGTTGQSKVWKMASSALARERFESTREAKRNKGYIDQKDSISPTTYPERIAMAHEAVPYELYWFASSPVTHSSMQQAAAEADRLLDSMGRFANASVVCQEDPDSSLPSGYVVMSAGGREAFFGFPSADYRQKLKGAGRSLGEHFDSFDGWLGSDGKGMGTIEVGHSSLDLPVRVFLCRLIAAMGGCFRAEDLYGELLQPWVPKPTESVGNRFAWVQRYSYLYQAMASEGLLPGSIKSSARLAAEVGGEAVTIAPLW